MQNVELKIGKLIYSGWQSLNVTRSIEDMAGSFQLGIVVNTGDTPIVIEPGAECILSINSQTVVTGYVDTISVSVDGRNRIVNVDGRDKTADLIDCAAIAGKGQWRNVSLEKIANDLCKPFGINVKWDVSSNEASAPFTTWQIEQGETVFDNLSRAARHRGILMTSNAAGELVFTTPSEDVIETLLLGNKLSNEGVRILSIDTEISWIERFSLYRVKGDAAAGGTWGETQSPAQSTSTKIDVIDEDITRYRPTIIIADDNLTQSAGNQRAQWEKKRAKAHGTKATVRVQNWFTRAGNLWETNAEVLLKATAAGFDDVELLIVSTTFILNNDEGTVTELELMPREGFEEPAVKDNKSTAGGGRWQ